MTPISAIAHYRITRKLGEGGMGAVYRANDTKLHREVAIKVLPPAFSDDPARMARFEREAQTLASLNHPNIAAIYGVEQGALVMELVEGADLHCPVPVDTAVEYALQIATALEAAHEKGVVHRDLKPANIKVTPDGQVKLLDFGLAKAADATSSAASPASPTISPTLSIAMTQAGMILGTAAYMAPEQARGKTVDKRADIWAFGVVLYEMLSGRQLFAGDTVTDVIAAVVTREPDWSILPAETPAQVRRLLERCLQRDPKLRLRDIGEARIALSSQAPAEPAAPAPVAASPSRVPWFLSAILAIVAIAAGFIAIAHFRETPPAAETVRFQIQPPEGWVFSNVSPTNGLALSPDGKYLAFVAARSGHVRLFVQPLDSLTAREIPGTEGAGSPFWSPDSRSLGIFVPGELKRVEVSGAPPVVVCEVPAIGVGGAWNRDGTILFGINVGPLYRVSARGGRAEPLTKLDASRRETFHARPSFLPDGRHYLYLGRTDGVASSALYVGDLAGGTPKRLLSARESGAYAPPAPGSNHGHVLFLRDGTLLAQPVNPTTYDPDGDPFAVAEKVGYAISSGFFTVSPTGALAFRGGGFAGDNQLQWFDRSGRQLGYLGGIGLGQEMDLSPDGRRVIYSRIDSNGGNQDLWVMDVARGIPVRFTFDPGADRYPVWSPDGSRVVFAARRQNSLDLYVKDAGGVGAEQPLLKDATNKMPWDWSADDKYLLFGVSAPGHTADLWTLPIEGGGKPEAYLSSAFPMRNAKFSPGVSGPRWVAYDSNESGRLEVYVQSFPPGRGKFQISSEGGSQPQWRPDGKELYYVSLDARIMAVDVKTLAQFEAGPPRPLFSTRVFGGGGSNVIGELYEATRDGSRFLIETQVEETKPSPITVALNWAAGLKK